MHELVIIFAKYLVGVPVLVLAVIFFRLKQQRRLAFATFLVASAIVTVLLAKVAAALHQDPRPFVRDGVTPYFAHGRDNGFPSDHTTYSALIAFVVLRYNKWLGAALAVLSLAIGSARVIAGIHHGQDIIGGFVVAALGVAVGYLLTVAAKSLYSRPNHTEATKGSDSL